MQPGVRRTPRFLRALHVGARCTRPSMGVRPAAPTIETIVPLNSYEIINLKDRE